MAHHALTLTPEVAAWLQSGLRDVPLDTIDQAERCEPGQPVRLMTPAGALSALALADPENALIRVMALADEGFTALDVRFVRARLERALGLRARFPVTSGIVVS